MNQTEGRLLKATKLAEYIRANGGSASLASDFSPETWKRVAKAAGTRVPSEKTIEVVVQFLTTLEVQDEERSPLSGL